MSSGLMLTPQVGNTIAEDCFACHFQKREKIPKPLFSPVIILLKEMTTTPKPYFCGQDVVGLLFLHRPPFSLQKLVWVTVRLQGVSGGLWELEGKS